MNVVLLAPELVDACAIVVVGPHGRGACVAREGDGGQRRPGPAVAKLVGLDRSKSD